MALLKYFKATPRSELNKLPDPNGPLSFDIPSPAIAAANDAVTALQQAESQPQKRGPYLKLTDEVKARIGKYASENGDSSAAKHFSKVCLYIIVIIKL